MTWPSGQPRPDQPRYQPAYQPGYPPPAGPGYPMPPGYPPAPGFPPAPPPGTNGFAVASLVLSLMCVSLLALIFGIVALSQIKRRGQSGRGMAVAGVVISSVTLLLFGAVATVAGLHAALNGSTASSPETSSPTADLPEVRLSPTLDLSVGDCIEDLPYSSHVASVSKIDCDRPHRGEVYEVVPVAGERFPGDETMDNYANKCGPALDRYAPAAANDSAYSMFYLHPTRETWKIGDRTITCVVTTEDKRTGSVH